VFEVYDTTSPGGSVNISL